MTGRKDATEVKVAVVGLGRFGESVARTLNDLGYEVTAIDSDERRVAQIADDVTLAAQGDGTDEEVLRSLHVDRSDVGVVGQGKNLEASVIITLLLKKLGVPWVIAKAESALHGELLARIGADRIVYPERSAGIAVAHSLLIRNITDYISLSRSSGVAKLTATRGSVGRTLHDLIPAEAPVDVLLVRRGSQMLVTPDLSERVQVGDDVVVVGPDAAIDAFADAIHRD
ncbi:MAG: TrkA family potassium uptake protein [Thermomicrobiales bacterium]|nr:TrkA family potassium uptake protein [Thermomicrobiales bacterium]